MENETYSPISERPETYILPGIFVIIFVVGILGNGTLIVVFFKHRAMRNIPNTYILSLAIADLLVIVVCVPYSVQVYILETWPWSETVCKVTEAAKDISIAVSVFTLTALSADRFFAIVNPLRKFLVSAGSKRATWLTVMISALIWLLAGLCSIPALLGSFLKRLMQKSNNNSTEFTVCYPYPEEWGVGYTRGVVIGKFLVFYVLPLAIISVFYALMARHLLMSAKNVPGEIQGARRQIKARKKVAVTVLIFVLVFAVCFLPHHIFMLWFHLIAKSDRDYTSFWHYFRMVSICLSFLNSCVNPIALYCVSGTFRKFFNRYLLCRRQEVVRSRCNTSQAHKGAITLTSTVSRPPLGGGQAKSNVARSAAIAQAATAAATTAAIARTNNNVVVYSQL